MGVEYEKVKVNMVLSEELMDEIIQDTLDKLAKFYAGDPDTVKEMRENEVIYKRVIEVHGNIDKRTVYRADREYD